MKLSGLDRTAATHAVEAAVIDDCSPVLRSGVSRFPASVALTRPQPRFQDHGETYVIAVTCLHHHLDTMRHGKKLLHLQGHNKGAKSRQLRWAS